MQDQTRVFEARRIVTMAPSTPFATHVAVCEGRVLGVGSAEQMAAFGPAIRDDSFAGKVILPGFVEGHSHLFEGLTWQDPYLGFFDRRGPDGRIWPGLKGIEEVVARLQEIERATEDPDAPLTAWGFDPIYFGGRRMNRADLDQVSTRRPVAITHASGHIMNVNGIVLHRAGLTGDTDLDGLARGPDGQPSGELLGPEVMGRVRRVIGGGSMERAIDAPSLRRFGEIARMAGVTTAADLLNELTPATVGIYEAVTQESRFPLRIVPALAARAHSVPDGITRWRELAGHNNPKLHFGLVKLVVDGSIQGFTARLRWPGYHNGAPNGMWYLAPAELAAVVLAYHRAGAHLHIHTNGDEATEVAVEMIGRALQEVPRGDHRHTLQHCQMPDEALYRRMKTLGICCNIFSNHIFYWGDAHLALTMGPTRAARMDACGTALRLGVPFAIHSDAPVTPLGPLFTAWCAVNRRTASGVVLGEHERIPVADALRAITLGAAYTMRMDHLVGSLDVGKFADFAILDDDPLEVPPEALKDVGVHATVLGGVPFQGPA